jgi:hypothetical protein
VHRGSDGRDVDLALFLKRNGYRPDRVQEMSRSMLSAFVTGSIRSRRRSLRLGIRDRKLSTLLQFFKPRTTSKCEEPLAGRRGDWLGLRRFLASRLQGALQAK